MWENIIYKIILPVIAILCCTTIQNSAQIDLQDERTIVTMPSGKIRGHILETAKKNEYVAFQEIPYASPPIGKLRFKDPILPKYWQGILNTTSNTKVCYQSTQNDMDNEDCLYLNVYVPLIDINDRSLLPVLVYIFGGGFKKGDGTFKSLGPDFFIDQDIIVVTFNYRLGAFGFLSTADNVVPGNQGLKDQYVALKWVNTNIGLFGGNSSKVTIMGESAGAASVGFHLISGNSRGLFRAAILESGTAICSWAYQRRAKLAAYQLAAVFDSDFTSKNSSEDLLSLLQSVPASAIRDANVSLEVPLQIGQGYTWAPVIEGEYEGAFITEPMYEVIQSGEANTVPILIGVNSEERISFASDLVRFKEDVTQLDKNLSLLVNEDFKVSECDILTVGEELRSIYTNTSFATNLGAAIRFMSDARYTTPVIRHADLQSKFSDVFFYQFSYYGVMGNRPSVYVEGAERVSHGADLNYFWRSSNNSDIDSFPETDVLTHKRLVKLWANFIKHLNPTPIKEELLQNIEWPKVTTTNFRYLNINTTLDVLVDPKNYKSWTNIVDSYGNPSFDTY